MKKYLKEIIAFSVAFSIVMVIRGRLPETERVFSQIVTDMGYQVADEPIEVVEFTVPKSFNRVYDRYNNLLKEGGYDLSPYKGKNCTRYTYLIPEQNARANIIVYNGKVIGGDISSITIDGIMIPIKRSTNNASG